MSLTTGCVVLEHIAIDFQILPADEDFHRSHLQRFQCVIDAETIFPGILGDFVKVLSFKDTAV